MSWFRRSSATLPAADLAALRERRPEAGRVLAVGQGAGSLVAACEECLAVRRGEDGWEFVGWHLVTRGGWDGPSGVLRWSTIEGGEGSVRLEDAGQVPGAFRDRVDASIVLQQAAEAPGGGTVVVAGRRRLGRSTSPEDPVVWQVTTTGAARLDDPAVADLARQLTARLRDDVGQ